jgi:uncharacterized phage protein gp47/JayE
VSGTAGNAPAGTALTLVTPVAGISSDAVATNGLTGGSDIEPVSELLARLEFRAQYRHAAVINTTMSAGRGNVLRNSHGVPRTWQGPGTVGVAFVMDGNSSIIPGDSDIARVTDYIAGHPNPITGVIEGQPEGPEVAVFAPKLKPLDMTIKISPKTDAGRMK